MKNEKAGTKKLLNSTLKSNKPAINKNQPAPTLKNLRGKRGSDHDSAGRTSRNNNAPSQTERGED